MLFFLILIKRDFIKNLLSSPNLKTLRVAFKLELVDNHQVFMAAYLDDHAKHLQDDTCRYTCCKVPQNIFN